VATDTLNLLVNVEAAVTQEITEEMRMKLRHEFGFSFLVLRDKIQAELSISHEQEASLQKYLRETAPADLEFLQAKESRGGDFDAYRSKAIQKLDASLQEILSDAQRRRLAELVRQREGLFGGPSLWNGLQITDEEKTKFMAVIEPMQKKMHAAASEAEHGANTTEVQHRVLALRADLERQMEAVLTESQRQRWQEMTGKPIAVEALFDLSGG
jgi:hypothetical protein